MIPDSLVCYSFVMREGKRMPPPLLSVSRRAAAAGRASRTVQETLSARGMRLLFDFIVGPGLWHCCWEVGLAVLGGKVWGRCVSGPRARNTSTVTVLFFSTTVQQSTHSVISSPYLLVPPSHLPAPSISPGLVHADAGSGF